MSGLQNRDDALAAGGADRDQAAPATVLVQRLGQRGDDPPTGCRERMPGGQRGTVHVQLRAVDRAERAVQVEAAAAELRVLPRLEGGEHGAGERLVDLDE